MRSRAECLQGRLSTASGRKAVEFRLRVSESTGLTKAQSASQTLNPKPGYAAALLFALLLVCCRFSSVKPSALPTVSVVVPFLV